MLRRPLLLLALCLPCWTPLAAEETTAPAVVLHRLRIPGCDATIELPRDWELANAVPGALVVLQGPPEHAMPLGEALAARPIIAITVQPLATGMDPVELMATARSQQSRMLSDFTVLSGTETSRTLSGWTWQYLRYQFALAQQSCTQELYIGQDQGVAIFIVCSCAPSRAAAYAELFRATVASIGGSAAPALSDPAPGH